MKSYIGIDGGGTKTVLIASDKDRNIVSQVRTTGSSWREHGFEGVAALIADAVDKLKCGDIGGIAMGLPCFGESTEGDVVLRRALEKALPGIPLYLTNDVEVGWAGSFSLRPGIHLVGGTGSIAYGVDKHGTRVRSGGWDDFFSDEGSAYWIARRGMELFSKQSDGRMPKGSLLYIVREEFSLKRDVDFIDCFLNKFSADRKERAAFQLVVKKAALAGDIEVCKIYDDAAAEFFMMAKAVKQQLNMPTQGWQVSYYGGVFKSGDLILAPLRKLIEADGGILRQPENSPTTGALLLAIDMFA